MMIDLHSHILPGLDDGARTVEDSLEIAREAVADGIIAIAATPHVRDDYPTRPTAMEEGVAEVRAALQREAIPLELLTGGELALEQLGRLSVGELSSFGLGGNPRVLLVETPYYGWPVALSEELVSLRREGFIPVLAHPERNAEVQAQPRRLAPFVQAGVLVQVTAASVDGRIGRRAQACGRYLIDRGLAHLIASDAHHASVRAVGMAGAAEALEDDALAAWLTREVPAAIVNDTPIPGRPATRRKGGWARKLFEA
jgi:protein-tyrosine phosphatase